MEKIKKLEVIPLEGSNLFKFGDSQDTILEILGEPEDIEKYEEEDDEPATSIWFYEDTISLFFDEIDDDYYALKGIESSFPDTYFKGNKVIGLAYNDLKKFLNNAGYNKFDEEIEEWGEKRVSIEDDMVDFYLEDDEVVSVAWSSEY
ncbi:MAG TPA: hypothetical protein PLQ91_07270 [Bacteroidales bacterium]|nr:hypothetical protein [Bacteroidales bacterium]NLY21965.1 hypothetical protein [Bacteroidales bacterium]HPU47407.1 hypothetical protein [Bacteroidales bacterium]HXK91757.1 hypothetical protein [Bacteroidales bacterium]